MATIAMSTVMASCPASFPTLARYRSTPTLAMGCLAAPLKPLSPRNLPTGASHRASLKSRKMGAKRMGPVAMASSNDTESGAAEITAAVGGLIAVPVVAWSLYTLKTTGCGLPPGPGGAIGALEGVSYLVVVGVVGWSAYTKVKTGSGLPNGPFGLLGAVEGLSYLVILASLVVLGFQIADFGYVPSAVPDERCFG